MEPNRCFTWFPQGAPPPPLYPLRGLAKPSLFQCLLRLGQQNHLFCNARRLGVLICSTLAIFEAPGASCRSLLLNSGDLVRKKGMFLMSGSQILHKLHFRNAKIHQTPLTSKSKEGTPKNRDQHYDQNLHVQDLPESSVYTGLPVIKTIPTAAVWA